MTAMNELSLGTQNDGLSMIATAEIHSNRETAANVNRTCPALQRQLRRGAQHLLRPVPVLRCEVLAIGTGPTAVSRDGTWKRVGTARPLRDGSGALDFCGTQCNCLGGLCDSQGRQLVHNSPTQEAVSWLQFPTGGIMSVQASYNSGSSLKKHKGEHALLRCAA